MFYPVTSLLFVAACMSWNECKLKQQVKSKGLSCQNWSPLKSVRPDQFWQPKLVPLANFGPPYKNKFATIYIAISLAEYLTILM